MKDSTSIAPGGASSMTLPVDAFAYEFLHGVGYVERLLEMAVGDLPASMTQRYPELADMSARAAVTLQELLGLANHVWNAEAKRAEGAYDPAVTAALEKAVDAVRAGFTGGAYNKADSALDAAALRVRALLEPPCTQTD